MDIYNQIIPYYQKAYEYESRPYDKDKNLKDLRQYEVMRDYVTGQITEIHHLVQFDEKPNDLKEARWDIYKVSTSLVPQCKDNDLKNYFKPYSL